jgi:hypothetical protein
MRVAAYWMDACRVEHLLRRLRWPAVVAGAGAVAAIVAFGWPGASARVQLFKDARDIRSRIVDRLEADVRFVRAELDAAPISAAGREALHARLVEAADGIASIPRPDPVHFTTVLPLNATHAGILATHGAMLAASGLPPIAVWKTHRYDAVPLLAVPPPATDDAPSIDIVLMAHEYRADAFLLTNATGEPYEAGLNVSDVPGAPRPDWLGVSGVEWTDTRQGVPVADALPDARFVDDAYRLTVPAGMTRKVWLTVDGSRLAPGTHRGALTVRAAGASVRVPFTVRVSRVAMARPRLSLGMWDYTNGAGAYGITPHNRDAAIALMRSHFVDSPWATGVLPVPVAADFDAIGGLARPLDFRALDAWIRLWPGARRYYVTAGAGLSFAGASMGTPEFAARLAAWGRAVARHSTALGLAPQQLVLMLVDEPRNQEQNAIIAAWGGVLKAAAPEIGLFENPIWPRPDEVSPSEAFTLVDELCFHLGVYSRGGAAVARYFEGRRTAGQRLWIYQTTGPARLLDPTAYYRSAGWHAFRANAVGVGFWAFGDTGGAETSWNDYAGTGELAYAPAFIGRQDATDSIHWQAVREGVEDYEYLAMLGDLAARSPDAQRKAEALALIREAIAEVPVKYTGWFDWDRDPGHARPDEYRLRILALLESLSLS